MNNAALLTAIKNQHALDVADRRLGEQRIIDEICLTKIIPLEKRVTRLEHWRTFLTGAMAGVTTWLGFKGH